MGNPSSVLVIFDDNIDQRSLCTELEKLNLQGVHLFPLSSDWRLIHDIKKAIHYLSGPNFNVELLESSKLIDHEVDLIRDKIYEWTADFGEIKIVGKSIKEWFLLPREKVSTWWFSLISEKNAFKTDAFFKLAQLNAIDKILVSNSMDVCFVSHSEKFFQDSMTTICERYRLNLIRISSLRRKLRFKEKIKSYFNKQNISSFVLKALIHFVFRAWRALRAKLVMGPIEGRANRRNNSVLFVSYFPAVNKRLAEKGILKNKFAVHLQEMLSKMDRKIIWIWMYADIDKHSFGDALKMARRFKKNGEANFFLDEFMSLRTLFEILGLWIRQFRIYLRLKKRIPAEAFYEYLSVPEGSVFIKNLMARSFIGWIGLEGILYFMLYKNVFSEFSFPSYCIYSLEMQNWEKGLNAAKKIMVPYLKSIGYQHASILQNLSYFYHPNETAEDKGSLSLPLPDIFACNGDIPLSLVSKCKYPNVRIVEAIRFLYLNDYLKTSNSSDKRNIVLIAGSTDKQETKALISLFHTAFPNPEGFVVWLKGHPALPFERILKELGINILNCGYKIKYEPIMKLFEHAKILIVGSTTVCLEGLARCCQVISPIFSDKMFMSPLKGYEEFYEKVYDPEELRNIVRKSFENDEKKPICDEAKKFVSRYWCLDPSLKRWKNILSQ